MAAGGVGTGALGFGAKSVGRQPQLRLAALRAPSGAVGSAPRGVFAASGFVAAGGSVTTAFAEAGLATDLFGRRRSDHDRAAELSRQHAIDIVR